MCCFYVTINENTKIEKFLKFDLENQVKLNEKIYENYTVLLEMFH